MYKQHFRKNRINWYKAHEIRMWVQTIGSAIIGYETIKAFNPKFASNMNKIKSNAKNKFIKAYKFGKSKIVQIKNKIKMRKNKAIDAEIVE